MSFKVAETHAEVTKAYLKASLEYQYRGKEYKFSDDLLTILESDYKRKVRNLDWLFKGATRIRLKPSAESVFEQLISDRQDVADFITIASCFGYEITPEDFVAGYVVHNKQKLRLAKSFDHIFCEETLAEIHKIPAELTSKYTKSVLSAESNPYKPEFNVSSNKRDFKAVGDGYYNIQGLVVNIHTPAEVRMTWKPMSISADSIMSMMDSSEVILSIDINDYITCSEGSFSSCMSEKSGSSRHLGWMMHFRSDFSVMTFTHKKGDEFYKTGRSWTYIKMTEDGLPFQRPFYKLSRIYGVLNKAHVGMVDHYIQKAIKETFNLPNPKKHTDAGAIHYGDLKYIASPNMQNTTSNAQGTGYFDWPYDNTGYLTTLPLWEYEGEYPVTPFTSSNYKRGPICLFNFPDALDVNGEPTNEARFNNNPEHHYNAFFGWNERVKQFVTCKATGNRILLRDALEVAQGEYIHKDIAISIIAGKPIEYVETAETAFVPTEAPVDISDIDVDDF